LSAPGVAVITLRRSMRTTGNIRTPILEQDRWAVRVSIGKPPEDTKGGIVRALIVDDSRAMRSILRRILNELGFEAIEASDGEEGLKCLARLGKADLALVDWNMPRMNGYEFVRAVRAVPAYDGMPLMMVTTESEIGKVSQALAAGANEYVMKPFTKEMVVEKLAMLGMP